MKTNVDQAVDRLLEQRIGGAYSALLRKAIKDKGLSFAELARQTGLSRPSLTRFYWGEASLRLDLADKLAAFLGVKARLP